MASTAEAALDKFFSAVDMPSLCDLTLEFSPHPDRVLHFPVLNPIRVEKLTKLHISCGARGHFDIMQTIFRFLSQTTHVTNLCISDSDLGPEFISGLKVTSRLPRLRVLDISNKHWDDSLVQNVSVIYDMFETRCLDVVASGDRTPGANDMDVGVQSTTFEEASRLETIRVPRWLYFANDERWKVICDSVKVECGITMDDAN
ncbi:hypothetical protein CPB85DRAFT_1437229 [Mucidula mucida]|nr:hypothetical protein CPB85DRAFT_1437229 [Mucidula mucida]